MPQVPLPQGVVTFLLTDIEGSTAAWESRTETMVEALRLHDEIGEEVITRNRGHLVKKIGDALFAVFESPAEALRASIELQLKYSETKWPGGASLPVRMGLHIGESADVRDGDYFGPVVNRCARIQSAANGGQILVSEELKALAAHQVGPQVWFEDLGEHRLKDLSLPLRLHQVCAEGLRSEFPPISSLTGYPNNLPTQPTTFVGRKQELEHIGRLLASRPLVVLLGPGGTGKTRLALQIAAECTSMFPQGTWFVPLDQITEGTTVVSAVADRIGVQERPGQSLQRAVLDYLRDREVLLILDNSEHMVQEVTAFAADVTTSCPKTRILATTRERLRVMGATTYEVDPLPVGSESDSVEALTESPAIRLFLDRAEDETQKFQVDEERLRIVAKLCSILDGVPYMIELAAARARSMPLETILARIDDRFRVLGAGDLTRAPRQQSLRALIDWSYELLDPDQKTLFRRLAVFVGGWSLEAAEKVVSAEPIDEFDVVDLLTSLVDKSLVAFDQVSKRYRMLETVRKYAIEALTESGESDLIEQRHADYFLAFSAWVYEGMGKADEPSRHLRCDGESENLRKVLRQNAAVDPKEAMQALVHLFRYLDSRARYSEPREMMEALIGHGEIAADLKLRTAACQALGNLCRRQGDFDAAMRWFELGMEGAETQRDPMSVGSILANMATISLYRSEFERAQAEAERGVSICTESGNWRAVVTCHLVLTNVHSSSGDLNRAQADLEAARLIVEQQGFDDLVPYVETNLSLNLMKLGEHVAALSLLARRAESLLAEGNRPTLLEVFRFAAEALLGARRYTDSAALYALEERLRAGYQISLSDSDAADRAAHIEELKEALASDFEGARGRWVAVKEEGELCRLAAEFLQEFSAAVQS